MTQQAVINQEKFVRIGGEIIDVEITEITVNYLGKPAKQVMGTSPSPSGRRRRCFVRRWLSWSNKNWKRNY